MAISKTLLLSIFLVIVYLTMNANAQDPQQGAQIDCEGLCGYRCHLSSHPNSCKRACGTCCQRCNCVPPGTSGNENVCPCYANMTTHGGKQKCP